MSACYIVQGDAQVLGWKIKTPINCIITDPPYGMAMKSNRAETTDGKRFTSAIANDENLEVAQATFSGAMYPLVDMSVDHCDMYVFCRWDSLGFWIDTVNKLSPFKVSNVIVWDKVVHGTGDLDGSWANQHEMIIYAKKGRRHVNKRLPNVISIPKVGIKERIHPTEKPVALIERLIEVSTNPDDLIVDPFCGSGSTIVAAQRLGRRALGFELDTENGYVERAKNRLEQRGLFT